MKDRSAQRRAGFTLVELLVVIGVIAVLIGILVPVLGRAREQAKRTVCASQLRQLVTASVLYLGQHRRYPYLAPLPAGGAVYPSGLDVALINQITGTLRLPSVDTSMSVEQLPQIFRPPQREEIPLLMACDPSFGTPTWNAGYSYHGSADTVGQTGVTLRRDRVPDCRGRRRGVLWSDHLLYVDAGPGNSGYGYYHLRGAQQIQFPLGTLTDAKSLRGLHRAWTDGSVEWLNASELDVTPANADRQAPYRWMLPTGWRIWHFF